MSLHTCTARVPTSQEAVSHSCTTLTGAELLQAKNILCICAHGCFSRVRLCDPVACGLPDFSIKEGGSPGKDTGAYWPVLVAIPS